MSRSRRLLASAFCLLALLFVPPVADPAIAQEEDVAIVTDFIESPEDGSIEIGIDGTPASEIILLRNPDRIAIDLRDTVTAVRPPPVAKDGPIASIRDGLVARDRYRIVLDLRRSVVPTYTSREENGRTVLTIALRPASAAAFARAVSERSGRTVEPVDAAEATAPERVPTIVIDPGHGGEDDGAVGEGGTLEKELNLSFALALRDALAAGESELEVVLTREDDTFIPLAERSAMARRAGADLFVSIHADSIRYEDVRGATVYTLSATASDALAGEVAESENAADRFVGPEWTQDTPEIHDILVDLVRRETEQLSRRFADDLVIEMRREDIRLINNPARSAGFRVLMTPDVPSVLVEMGYLSNAEDETLMSDPAWRSETAAVLAGAIKGFLAAR